MDLLDQAIIEADKKAENGTREAVAAINLKLTKEKDRLRKQADKTKKDLCGFVGERFLDRCFKCTIVDRGVRRITEVVKVTPVDNLFFHVTAKTLVKDITIPGCQFFGKLHKEVREQWREYIVHLDGRLKEPYAIEDPDGYVYESGILPKHANTKHACRIQENINQARERADRIKEQIKCEKNAPTLRMLRKALVMVLKKIQYMEENDYPVWYVAPKNR